MTGFGQSRIAQRGLDVRRPGARARRPARARRLRPPRSGRSRRENARPAPSMTMTRTVGSRVGRVERGDQRLDQLGGQGVELGRPVERQADAPRRSSASSRTGASGSGIVAVPPARPARRPRSRPPADAMTGLRSTSRMSGRSIAEAAERHQHGHDGRPIDGRPAADPAQQARAAEVVEHGAGRCGVQRSEPDRDVVEDLGQDAAQPDEHGRPELRVAAQAEDELDARRRHRLDEQAADRQAVASARSRAASGRRRRPRRRPAARAPPRRPRSCGPARRRRA